jgi:hypothetical protein
MHHVCNVLNMIGKELFSCKKNLSGEIRFHRKTRLIFVIGKEVNKEK